MFLKEELLENDGNVIIVGESLNKVWYKKIYILNNPSHIFLIENFIGFTMDGSEI